MQQKAAEKMARKSTMTNAKSLEMMDKGHVFDDIRAESNQGQEIVHSVLESMG